MGTGPAIPFRVWIKYSNSSAILCAGRIHLFGAEATEAPEIPKNILNRPSQVVGIGIEVHGVSNKIIKLMGLSLSQLPSRNFIQSGNKFTTLIIIFGIHRRISKPLLVLPVY